MFISSVNLSMFQACYCPSSGGITVYIQQPTKIYNTYQLLYIYWYVLTDSSFWKYEYLAYIYIYIYITFWYVLTNTSFLEIWVPCIHIVLKLNKIFLPRLWSCGEILRRHLWPFKSKPKIKIKFKTFRFHSSDQSNVTDFVFSTISLSAWGPRLNLCPEHHVGYSVPRGTFQLASQVVSKPVSLTFCKINYFVIHSARYNVSCCSPC
jgi:hypothetical protein